MTDIVKEVIFELLQFRRAPFESTKVCSQLMHNSDLCPQFHRKLELILDAHRKYQQITYDMQGFRDRGSDVAVRQRIDGENSFICLQIKSENDLKDIDYMMRLKAQFFEAQGRYQKLLDYYIVLCCNLMPAKIDKKRKMPLLNTEKKNQIRAITAEFATTENVHVIEPEYALTFLKLSSIQIDAAIKSKLGSEDVVFREAIRLVNDLSPTERALIFYLIWLKIYRDKGEFAPEDIFDHPHLRSIYEQIPDYERDWFFSDETDDYDYSQSLEVPRNMDVNARIAYDLEHLEDIFIERNSTGNFVFDFKEMQSLALTMMDGNLRYGYEEEELLDYMMNLFGRMKGYAPKGDNVIEVNF